MTRLIGHLGCWLVVSVLISGTSAAAERKPDDRRPAKAAREKKKKQEKADQAKPAAEKVAEKAAETPDQEKTDPKKPDAAKAEPAKKPDAAKSTPPKPATATVKKELLKIDVSVKGVFEAQSMTPVMVRPKEWKVLQVVEAVEHGATVKKGDVLVQFELKDIDRAIGDHRTTLRLSELSLKQAHASLKLTEAFTPMDLAAAERRKRHANEDLKHYFDVDLPMSKRSEEFYLKSAKNRLEYQLEELRQLEKMYEADDLTEETEEIILKRQRDAVEQYEFSLERARLSYDRTLEVDLPRREQSEREGTERTNLSSDKSLATLSMMLEQKRLELGKLEVTHAKGNERLEKLLADRELLTVKSPAAGVVYYGKYVRGAWSGGTAVAASMRLGGKVTAGAAFMTVVKTRPMRVRATVPEKEIHWIRPGMKATVQPTAYPDLRLNSSLTEIEAIPLAPGNFAARLKVGLGDQASALVPGMTCSVKLATYINKRALTVPAKAVFADELDDRKQYVYVVSEDGKSKKTRVEVGPKSGETVEIVEGVSEGDKVLLARPKDD